MRSRGPARSCVTPLAALTLLACAVTALGCGGGDSVIGMPDEGVPDVGASADFAVPDDTGVDAGPDCSGLDVCPTLDAIGCDAAGERVCELDAASGCRVWSASTSCDDSVACTADTCAAGTGCQHVNECICGDGTEQVDEECDEGAGNGLDPDACRPGCLDPRCGDGVIDTPEVCDGGQFPVSNPIAVEGDVCSSRSTCGGPAPLCSTLGSCTDGSAGDPCTEDTDCAGSTPLCAPSGVCAAIRCSASPSAEICDGFDNDCNGTVDDGCPGQCTREDTPVVDDLNRCLGSCGGFAPNSLIVPCGAHHTVHGERDYAAAVAIRGWLLVRPVDAEGVGGWVSIGGTTIAVSGYVNGAGRGFGPQLGPGASLSCSGSIGPGWGASHAGLGGAGGLSSCETAYRGPTYTSTTAGSGGGNGVNGLAIAPGGCGGAGIALRSTVSMTVSGRIDTSGAPGSSTLNGAGGGSAGDLSLWSDGTLTLSGQLNSSGGAGGPGGSAGGGGGSGGALRLVAADLNTSGASMVSSGGAGGVGASSMFDGLTGAGGPLTFGSP